MVSGSPLPSVAFFFMRHGETDWNRKGLCVGQVDQELTDRGRQQAKDARRTLSGLGVAHVVHSPLVRAAETARIIAEGFAYELETEDDLREACLGVKEGLREGNPDDDFIMHWFRGGFISGAEPYERFKERVGRAVSRSVARAGRAPVLLVAHSGVFAAISDLIGHGVSDLDLCVPYRMAPIGGGWEIKRCG